MRKVIRSNRMVNDLLVQNKDQLLKLFIEFKMKHQGMPYFTLESANNLFGE